MRQRVGEDPRRDPSERANPRGRSWPSPRLYDSCRCRDFLQWGFTALVGSTKTLGLVLEAAKGRGMDIAVAVAPEIAAGGGGVSITKLYLAWFSSLRIACDLIGAQDPAILYRMRALRPPFTIRSSPQVVHHFPGEGICNERAIPTRAAINRDPDQWHGTGFTLSQSAAKRINPDHGKGGRSGRNCASATMGGAAAPDLNMAFRISTRR